MRDHTRHGRALITPSVENILSEKNILPFSAAALIRIQAIKALVSRDGRLALDARVRDLRLPLNVLFHKANSSSSGT
ncbi:MAG: hypothetical protein K5821_10510 [Nitrobacter sp.]|uniref:hypothetical protein n=1 Tax=Nitrobacter sp. TaxID=29420 RepID=UPI00260897CB|nr:hypothetical protein [Nitrobacter sp.]MCV0386855.1 hypothetical protein [Nitrobacter sp.]